MHGMGKVRKNKAKEPKKAGTLAAAAKAPKRQGGLWRAVKWTFAKSLKWVTVGAVWAVIAFSVLVAWYATELPDVEQAFNATRRPTVTVLAADGSQLTIIGDVYGLSLIHI